MGFPSQEYWRGLWFPSPGYLLDPGIESGFPTFQAVSLPQETPEQSYKPTDTWNIYIVLLLFSCSVMSDSLLPQMNLTPKNIYCWVIFSKLRNNTRENANKKDIFWWKYNFSQHRHWQLVTTVPILAWKRTLWKVCVQIWYSIAVQLDEFLVLLNISCCITT